MKAEERKQLETNELREQLSRLLHTGKKPPSVLWVLIAVGVVVVLGYWWLSGRTALRNADAWERYWKQRALMDAVGGELKGTPAEIAIALDAADAKYEEGFERLFKSPDLAVEELKAASTAYEELSKKISGKPDLQVRALLGAGKASEAMGDLPRAIFFYRAVKQLGEQLNWSEHPLVVDASQRLSKLDGQATSGQAFYQGWPSRLPKAQPLTPPPAPTPPAHNPLPTFPSATPAPTVPQVPPLPEALKPVPTGSLLPTSTMPTSPAAASPPPAPPASPPAATASAPKS
jgi:hypothetical protein